VRVHEDVALKQRLLDVRLVPIEQRHTADVAREALALASWATKWYALNVASSENMARPVVGIPRTAVGREPV
jgi:hypothetical protein